MAAAAGGNARTTPASVVAHVQAWRPSVPGLRLSANSDEHSATITASLTGKASFLVLDINSGVSFPTVRLLSDGPAAKAFNHDAEAFAYGERPRSVAELLAFAEARVAEILTASESARLQSASGSSSLGPDAPADATAVSAAIAAAITDADRDAAAGDREAAPASGDDDMSDDESGGDDDDDPYGDGGDTGSDGISEGDSLYGLARADSVEGLGASSSAMDSFVTLATAQALDAAMHPCVAGQASVSSAAGPVRHSRFTSRYRVLTQDQVLAGTVQLCRALAERFEVAEGDAALLLKHGDWDVAAVEASLSDAARREKVTAEAGARLFAPRRPPFPTEEAAAGELNCEICYDELADEANAFALDCGHWFCKGCWRDHCAAQCDCGDAGLAATCPAEGCTVSLGPSVFLSMAPPAKFALFRTLWLKSVAKGGFAAACTGEGCSLMAAFAVKGIRNVFCECAACFCFGCGERGHGPCDCELASVFTEKESWVKDPENGRLDESLKGKIKPCPNCKIPTEKVDGCQYIKCSGCKEPWCWMCGQFGKTVHHVYDCNDAPSESWLKSGGDKMFSDDGRFDWHLERFNNHMGSLAFATECRAECEAKRHHLIEAGYSPGQAEFVVESADLLVECRHICAWTYALAYFVLDSSARKMLQFAQKDLETYTEQLSAMVERQSVDKIIEDQTAIKAHMTALATFKSNMEYWTPPPGSKIATAAEVLEKLKGNKDAVAGLKGEAAKPAATKAAKKAPKRR